MFSVMKAFTEKGYFSFDKTCSIRLFQSKTLHF